MPLFSRQPSPPVMSAATPAAPIADRADFFPNPRTAGEQREDGSVVEEYLRGGGSREAASLRDFGDQPLFVLTAGVGSSASWMTAQQKSTTPATNSAYEVADGANHQGLEDEKQYASRITQAVFDVVTSVRTGQPLTSSPLTRTPGRPCEGPTAPPRRPNPGSASLCSVRRSSSHQEHTATRWLWRWR